MISFSITLVIGLVVNWLVILRKWFLCWKSKYTKPLRMNINSFASGRGINPLQAWNLYDFYWLSACIYDLKKAESNIDTDLVSKNGTQ